MSQNLNDKNRLLESLDFIDDAMLSDTLSRVRTDALIGGKTPPAKKPITWAKQIALIAACALILGAVMPVISFILPRIGVTTDGSAGAGNEESIDMSEFADMSERDLIEHIGEVPKEFKDIVERNLFADIWVSGDKIIKKSEEPFNIEVYDLYGKLLHRIDIKVDEPEYNWYSHMIHSLSDGTYLLVMPYNEYNGSNKAYKGLVTDARAIRFDKKGNVLFNTKLDITDGICRFEFFFETDDAYLLISGSYQKYDSYYVKLDKFGNVLKNIQMGGAEDDRLYWVYYTDGKLRAYMREHNLADNPIDILEVTMDEDFNVLGKVKIDLHYPADTLYPNFRYHTTTHRWNVRNFVLGYSPGHKDDPGPATWGDVSSVIEYGDFILIISERNTKMYPYLPMFWSSHCYYTETVYTAHALDGTILWRTAVDSTDYARLAAVKKEYMEERERIEKWMEENTTSE